MLVPGEYMLKPVSAEPVAPPQLDGRTPSTRPASAKGAPETGVAQDSEDRSFLLTLLRCLGAIHT